MASGMEVAMTAVFKWMGLDPQDTVKMIFAVRDTVYSADTRLASLQREQAEMRAMIELLLKRQNGEASNGSAEIDRHEIRSDAGTAEK